MANPLVAANVRVIGADIVAAKLARARPRILLQNVAMVDEMLGFIKTEVVVQTPVGPGHFGYHAREKVEKVLNSSGLRTTGALIAPAAIYWREFGTGMRYRGPKRGAFSVRVMTGKASTGGELAHLIATHALSGLKKFIKFYYGGTARWMAG